MIIFYSYAVGFIKMSDILNEVWVDIPGYEGLYCVSNLGKIRSEERIVYYGDHRSSRTNKSFIRKLTKNTSNDYFIITLSREGIAKTFYVHFLVALSFIGPRPDGADIRHKNGDPTDNRADNLCYGSRSDNMQDAILHGTLRIGERHADCSLTTKDVRAIVMSHLSAQSLSSTYNIRPETVNKIRRGDVRKRETLDIISNQPERRKTSKFNTLTAEQLGVLNDASISQRKAGQLIGVPQRTIWRWRNKNI